MNPPTPRRPAREFTGLGGYNFLAMVRRGFFYTFLLIYLRERLGLPATAVALIGAVNAAASTLGQVLVWGKLSDRTDRRAGLMMLGELIAGFAYLGTYAAFRLTLDAVPAGATLAILVACLGTTEFFWSMTDVGYRAALAQVTTRKSRGRFLGNVELTGLLGVGAGLWLAGMLYRDGEGFEDGSIWALAAAFILAGVPLIRFTLSHLDGTTGARKEGESASAGISVGFRRYSIALAVTVVGLWCFQQNHNYFVRLPDTAAATDEELSFIRMVFWVVGGLAAPIAGRLIDRLGARRGYVGSALVASVLPLTFVFTDSVPFAVVTLAVFGAFLTAFRTASYVLAAELTPDDARGRHFAVYNAVMAAGWGLAALFVGGPVADIAIHTGAAESAAYGLSFAVGAALGLTGLTLFGLRSRSSRGDGTT